MTQRLPHSQLEKINIYVYITALIPLETSSICNEKVRGSQTRLSDYTKNKFCANKQKLANGEDLKAQRNGQNGCASSDDIRCTPGTQWWNISLLLMKALAIITDKAGERSFRFYVRLIIYERFLVDVSKLSRMNIPLWTTVAFGECAHWMSTSPLNIALIERINH